VLRALAARGTTIILITHKLREILALTHAVTVLRNGRVVGTRLTAGATAADLARMMVGAERLPEVKQRQPHAAAQPVLRVAGITVKDDSGQDAVKNVSFEIYTGEIFAIASVTGNGQTELVEALAGLIKAEGGTVRFEGRDITGISARKIKEAGIGHIPENRHKRGLLLDSDLSENAILGVHYREPVASGGFIDSGVVRERVREIIDNFDVRPPVADSPARALSGGNQQKLIIGREFELRPKLLLVAQPTRGVDIGAIEFIHRKLIELRDAGTAILLVSAELEEVTALADRLLVMRGGRIVGEVDPKAVSVEEIGLMMTGGEAD